MKTNQMKPNRGPEAAIAARERKERIEPASVLFSLRSLCSFAANLLLLLFSAASASAATRYVWQSSPSPAPPFTSWTTAAHVIQDAVDAAQAGDEIVVTNGAYATGGRAVGTNVLVNRVAVDKPLMLRSVNGPQFTIIGGYQVPGTTNGDGAIRCVYLTNGASLSGFTLTNGATRVVDYWPYRDSGGGGVWCESTNAVVFNCVLVGNSAAGFGGGASYGTLNNCTVTGNSANLGGGAALATLNNCTLAGNSARSDGGGANYCTLNNCTLTGNSANNAGGGASDSTLINCTLVGNAAEWGGGANYCTLNNCTLNANSARYGGGASGGTLNSCTLTGNSAIFYGGGASGSTLNNCTLIGNSANNEGGGVASDWDQSRLTNCIVYFNTAPVRANYDSSSILNYCCTTPLPGGVGNIALDPQLASLSHLSATSPCRGAGNATSTTGADIDGEAWGVPPSIGCDEYRVGAVTGPLSVNIVAAYTNVAVGFPVEFTALIEGRTTASVWEFGDGVVVSNQPYASHAWTAPGDYAVVLRAYNESQPAGTSATLTIHVVEAIHHVAVGSTNPLAPYVSWATAATNIQDAVDAVSAAGALVLVSNGVYATGGRAVHGTMTNRVSVDKRLALRSVNGPQFTVIRGYQVPGTTNGDGAIRCVYLTNGASLSGFTLTNGATRTAGEWEREQNGGGLWCESASATVSNCVLVGNSAYERGGGTYQGTLNNCTLTGNSARSGGGARNSTLNTCTLTGNSVSSSGGGAFYSTLNNCMLTGNSAGNGGGASASLLNNCTLTGNSAQVNGGGVSPDGYASSSLINCIVYFNTAPVGANYDSYSDLNYCCTTPLPVEGTGNITLDPQLASASHLSSSSPCRGAGNAAYTTGVDIDGEAWANPPSIGCDEYRVGAVTGPLSVSILASYTNVAVGFPVDFTALIEGRTTASVWEFADGVVVSNQPYATHAWTAPGDYAVVLRAYNESLPGGVSAAVTVHVVMQPVHYVAADSANPVPPHASWATAAANIQGAVDVATVPGALVLVSNGVYATGGRAVVGTMTNRLAVDKPLTVRSVNGPQVTVIQGRQVPGTTNGDGAIRCVYLTTGASLSGFTLTNGATRTNGDYYLERHGGGVWCESDNATVSNCVVVRNSAFGSGGGAYWGTLNDCTLIGNSATNYGGGASLSTLNNCTLTGNSAGYGGGAYGGTLNNCTLTGNSANGQYGSGGGANYSTLNNCTLTGNSANGQYSSGGGAAWSTLNNCIVYWNTATGEANYNQAPWSGPLNYCCTTPMPTNGVGNITNAPLFENQAGGNLRLQFNSPCINAGRNADAAGPTDLDGLPRIVSGTVDIGAYEFQGPRSVISYAWLQHYGLPTDGSADATDPDADGHNTWQEWRCQTDPTNALSALRLLSASPAGTNVTVSWQSVAGVNYFLERSTNLSASPPFTLLSPNLLGQPGTTTFTDTNAALLAPLFYRVGVGQ